MGPLDRGQGIVLAVFLVVCALWVTTPLHHIDITVSALLGSVALLLTGVLKWEDVTSNKAAWDIFIWYGGLVRLGKALNEAGSRANSRVEWVAHSPPPDGLRCSPSPCSSTFIRITASPASPLTSWPCSRPSRRS